MTEARIAHGVSVIDSPQASQLTAPDTFAASMCFLTTSFFAIQLGGLAVLSLSGFRALAASATAAFLFFTYLFSLGYRIRVRITDQAITVIQSWTLISYRTRRFERGTASVSIGGTGDWGLPGNWPIAELCELRGHVAGKQRYVFIGPASSRHEIADFIARRLTG